MAIKMKQLEPCFQTGEGGGDEGGGTYPIPRIDIDKLGGEPNADQQAILNRFTAAKKTFDAFLAESIAMVQEMDKLKGPKREELLNKLRLRKDAEQPLRRNLISTYKALVAAFSEQDEAPTPPAKVPSKAAGGLRALSN
jgi:hypothetical protein